MIDPQRRAADVADGDAGDAVELRGPNSDPYATYLVAG